MKSPDIASTNVSISQLVTVIQTEICQQLLMIFFFTHISMYNIQFKH